MDKRGWVKGVTQSDASLVLVWVKEMKEEMHLTINSGDSVHLTVGGLRKWLDAQMALKSASYKAALQNLGPGGRYTAKNFDITPWFTCPRREQDDISQPRAVR